MSQVIGTFSTNGGHFQVTTNGISFVDDNPVDVVKDIGFLSENSSEQISEELKKECEELYKQTDIIHVILDISDKAKIASSLGLKDKEREIKIDTILSSKFEVVPWFQLLDFPSRQTFYDSVTKQTDLFERHKSILDFMTLLDFKITNLLEENKSQQELLWDCYQREYSYISQFSNRIIVRVKPNLMVEIQINGSQDNSVEVNKRYFIFYNPNQILKLITENTSTEEKRNLKIKSILYELNN